MRGQRVSHDFFDMLGVRMRLGRSFRTEEDTPTTNKVLVLSHGLWQRRFGSDPQIVGRSVPLNGMSYVVAGVLPASFRPIKASPDAPAPEMYAPLGYALGEPSACRGCQHLRAIGRLRDGVSLEQARAELATVMRGVMAEHPNDYDPRAGIELTPLARTIAGSKAVVGPDSGPGHIAAALGVPYIALFGATDPVRVAPWGQESRVIRSGVGCSPCERRRCPGLENLCMRTIAPERVFSEVAKALG